MHVTFDVQQSSMFSCSDYSLMSSKLNYLARGHIEFDFFSLTPFDTWVREVYFHENVIF